MEELLLNTKQKSKIKEKRETEEKNKKKRPASPTGPTPGASQPNSPPSQPSPAHLSLPPIGGTHLSSPSSLPLSLPLPVTFAGVTSPGVTDALTGHQCRPYKAPTPLSRPSPLSPQTKPPGCPNRSPETVQTRRRFSTASAR
jgi:hypothetical protein